ncbi:MULTISPECIES: sensor domain-containing diguanylate cyclase [Pseudomonas]|uniref:diguanylate cyclase n=1 Tax=Pseudomonas fluorescens TaxID=294 RepID=A0A0F4TLA3_PSEFL|nr:MULTISPECIES: GGDEF domain-containing protein [Pseudomonas]KJZ44177.1 diguanylate cyclase [Pseudomonas fluorescens]MBI3906308.1 GGDEF domain-containing protein [Pseudomonas fluorescens]
MDLHIPTLLVVSVFVFILMGLLTCHAWWRETRERPLAYLGAMMLLAALGVVLVSWRGRGVDVIPLIFGNMALLLSAAMNWTAMRVFVGRAPSLPGVFAGAGIWLILCLIPAFYDAMPVRVVVYSLLTAGYGVLTASEFWRSRKKLEVAYMPALVLTLLHTAFYIVRSVIDKSLPLDQALSGIGDGVRFFSFMLFESMLYVIGIAYVTLAMVKERAELKFKAAAFCDPLTGIGNRRAFMSHGEQLLTNCKRRAEPVALLLCDLDHFKRLNDSFGHPMGDQALIAFSRILTGNLLNHDVFGRIGGEEFACLLKGADEQEAVQVAERIRQAFSRLSLLEPGILSVSIGVVTTGESGYELSSLLSQADEALYGAKDHGRNRVQTLRKLYLNLTDS